jgi:hypothetical protein
MRSLHLTAHILLLVACGKSGEQSFKEKSAKEAAAQKAALKPLIDKHRDVATKQLAAFKAIAADAKALPPITERTALPTKIELDLGTTAFGPAWWFAGETADNPKDKDHQFEPTKMEDYVVRTLLEKGEWITFDPYDDAMGELATKAFESVTKYKHALVARASAYEPPTVSGDRTSFQSGTIAGDATLYSLPDGKRLGSFPFSVIQRLDSVSFKSDSSATDKLADAFRSEIRSAVMAELDAYVKGTAGAATPGAVAKEDVAKLAAQLQADINKWALTTPGPLEDIFGGDAKLLSIEIESGPPAVVVLKTTGTEPFEKHRAGIESVVAARLGVRATVKIEAK